MEGSDIHKMNRLRTRIVCLLIAGAATVTSFAEEKEGPTIKIAIIKADDIRGPTEAWDRFIAVSTQRNVSVSCGIICSLLVDAPEAYKEWLIALDKTGRVEFWNHGWDHKRWEENGRSINEFCGSGYEHQKDHFTRAQNIVQEVLGHPPAVFGSPFNGYDKDTDRVLRETPAIQLFFSNDARSIGGVPTAQMVLRGEPDGTGKPNAAKFAEQYEPLKDTLTFTVLQFHPNTGTFTSGSGLDEYVKTIDLLLNDGWTFMLPREYIAWLQKTGPTP